MAKNITSTAQMQCDKGNAPANLKVTSQSFMKIDDKPKATEKDKEVDTNIPPFGVCSVTQKKCVPQPKAWQKVSPFDSIDNNKKLTDESFCPCGTGGKITFAQTGQSGFAQTE